MYDNKKKRHRERFPNQQTNEGKTKTIQVMGNLMGERQTVGRRENSNVFVILLKIPFNDHACGVQLQQKRSLIYENNEIGSIQWGYVCNIRMQ